MSPADNLISRLDGVRRTGQGRWLAKCPAHDDRSPSLTVRELDDGRLLVHCFGGCEVQAVVGAVGLDMSDLFPEKLEVPTVGRAERRPFPAADVLRAVAHEAMVVLVAASSMRDGTSLPHVDVERLGVAVDRLQSALTMAGVTDV